jgi:hypothetical protein
MPVMHIPTTGLKTRRGGLSNVLLTHLLTTTAMKKAYIMYTSSSICFKDQMQTC